MPALPPSRCVSLLMKTLGRVLCPQQSDPKSWREGTTFPRQQPGPGGRLLSHPPALVSVAHPRTPGSGGASPRNRSRMVVTMEPGALLEAQSHPPLSSPAEWEVMAPRGPGSGLDIDPLKRWEVPPAPVALGSRDTFSSGFYLPTSPATCPWCSLHQDFPNCSLPPRPKPNQHRMSFAIRAIWFNCTLTSGRPITPARR